MPTYEELEAFVRQVMDGNDPLFAAKARLLLGEEVAPYSDSMVDEIVQNYAVANNHNEPTYLVEDYAALIELYGNKPIEYVFSKFQDGSWDRDWLQILRDTSRLDHEPSFDYRLKATEELLLVSHTNFRLAYNCIIALSYYYKTTSIPVLEKFVSYADGGVKADANQLLDTLRRLREKTSIS